MKRKFFKSISSIIVLCIALNFTPAVAKSGLQVIQGSADNPASAAPSPELRGLDHERLKPDELEEVERETIPPRPEDLARTAKQVRAFDCTTVTDVPNVECEALVALYASTNGAGWTDSTNWLASTTVSNWYGVYLTGGRVSYIGLNYNQLNGSIPPELGNLSNLENLWLSSNQLSGSIPPQLGNLSNLVDLSLYSNQLSGSIPSELGNLSSLQTLYLYSNQLSGSIPSALGNLSNLEDLWLNSNQLSGGIPSALGNLSNLFNLYLSYNQLSGSIPPELGSLSNLDVLILNSNQLSGSIPPQLGSLSNLQYLYLSENQLSGSIPPELGNLSSLQYLYLYSNQLSGSIPLSFVGLTSLSRFYFFDTFLCEPTTPEFLVWKATVGDWQGTGITCDYCTYLPLINR